MRNPVLTYLTLAILTFTPLAVCSEPEWKGVLILKNRSFRQQALDVRLPDGREFNVPYKKRLKVKHAFDRHDSEITFYNVTDSITHFRLFETRRNGSLRSKQKRKWVVKWVGDL